jgi:hypothetical protein
MTLIDLKIPKSAEKNEPESKNEKKKILYSKMKHTRKEIMKVSENVTRINVISIIIIMKEERTNTEKKYIILWKCRWMGWKKAITTTATVAKKKKKTVFL